MRTLLVAAVLCAATPVLAAPVERRLHSDNIDASSFLWNDWNKFVENYHPNYIADDDPATAWVEGAKGSGKGEWLHINVTPLEQTTQIRLKIRNGYQKSKDLFKANARAKQVTVRLMPSKVEQKVTLDDKDGWQDVKVAQPSGPVKSIEVAIDSVYEGTKYEDLCISDIQVFATSETPDNPAFEKSKHETLMKWRAARLAAAKLFKSAPASMPIYPAYEITSSEHETAGVGTLDGAVAAAAKDPVMGKEWKDALAVAAVALKSRDSLARAQLAPATATELPAADGLEVTNPQAIYEGGMDSEALRLPMLGTVASLFADQLRMLDVKDATTPSKYEDDHSRCKADVSWVLRSPPSKEATGPAKVQAILVGRCATVESRDGKANVRTMELYVYDGDGRLSVLVGDGHIEGYRWAMDGGKPMLVGGRALLYGEAIDAKKRDTVAAK